MTISEAAIKLGKDKTIINSYTQYDKHNQKWVFSRNHNLLPGGQAMKPVSFPKSMGELNHWWATLTDRQKHVLYSSINKDFYPHRISEKDYDKIKDCYDNWPTMYIAIYYGADGESCNQFVGEALFMAGKNLLSGGKYYSAKDIWEAKGPLVAIDKAKAKIEPGDIAAFRGTHVEIVTKVEGNSFCSIGAGRGGHPYNIIGYRNGKEECGDLLWPLQNRYIDNENVRFIRYN